MFSPGLILLALHFLLGVVAVLYILLSDSEEGMKAAWVAFFFLAPVTACVLYIFIGMKYRNPRDFDRLHRNTLEMFRRDLTEEVFRRDSSGMPEQYKPLSTLLESCNKGNIVSKGNSFEIITEGQRMRELFLRDLENATRFIHLEFFRFGADKTGHEIREILERKAADGVEVRVIYPNIPNRATPRAFFDHMIKAGVQVIRYTNFRTSLRTTIMRVNYQDHRKIAVIDGQVAYTGGMNLNDNYFYHWRDTHLRIEGPAVHALDAAFLDTFMSSAGRITRPLPFYFPDVVPAGEGKTLQIVTDAAEYPFTAAEHAYLWILDHARDYVYLQTPYFMPPEPVLAALKGAALRGVDVRVMLPKEVDTPFFNEGNASYYEECVQAGIKIFIRGGEFIHSKTLVCDDCLAVIGASNLDHRSFRLNNEVNTFIYDRDTALRCKEIFLEDGGEPLDIQKWRKERTIWSRILSAIMRMLSFNM